MKDMNLKFRNILAAAIMPLASMALAAEPQPVTPIRHLVVIVGENHAFDTLFATFKPEPGASVANLLSRGIVDEEGRPARNFQLAAQKKATPAGRYAVAFPDAAPYAALPRAMSWHGGGKAKRPDERMPADLPPGPYQITRYVPYGTSAGADPVHRFFQMWQQANGGRNDLFVWVGQTSNEPAPRTNKPSSGAGRGGEAMGFYNMAKGDAPVFERLARRYALADNYHQSVMGGTMANYIALASADVAAYLVDGKAAPPTDAEQESPEPLPGSANSYTRSGYRGGSYSACADVAQPGVAAIRDALQALPYKAFRDGNCDPGHFYLLNNYTPPYQADGKARKRAPFTATAQAMPSIGGALAAAGVSWKWYTAGREGDRTTKEYCPECDAMSYFPAVMESPLRARLQGLKEFQADVARGDLPSVSFLVPPNNLSGHPGYSNIALLEGFLTDVIDRIEARPALWADTAVLVTFDEGGGYYDSGYIQAIDFFGDGTRIPFIAVSPWARAGHVEHTYYDHASLLKFIERNWGLPPLSARSRDNLPNPRPGADPYVPANRPAVGDLFELFDFTNSTLRKH